MKKNQRSLLVVIAVIVMTGCSENRLLRNGALPGVWEQQSDSRFLRVIGVGVSPQGTRGDTLTKGLARQAALSSARFELAAILRGIRLVGGTSVSKLASTHSEIKEKMNQLLSGAIERRVEFTKDGGAVVLVEIARGDVQKMLDDISGRESSAVSAASLEQQIKAAEAKIVALKARLPGIDE